MTILEHTTAAVQPAMLEIQNGKSKLFLVRNGISKELCGARFIGTSVFIVYTRPSFRQEQLLPTDVLQFYSVK